MDIAANEESELFAKILLKIEKQAKDPVLHQTLNWASW